VNGLIDGNDDTYINTATIAMSLYGLTIINPDAASVADNSGKPQITITGHTLVAGDVVRLVGTPSYDGEFTIDSVISDKITLDTTYTNADALTGNEEIYKGIINGTNISLQYVAASDGNYKGVLPDIVRMFDSTYYYMFVAILAGATVLLFRKKWKAVYKS